MIESLRWTLILPVSQLWQESPPGSFQKVQIQSLPFSNLFSDRSWNCMTFNNSGFWLTLGKRKTVWKIKGRKKNEARKLPGYSPEGLLCWALPPDIPLRAAYSTSSHHPLYLKVLFWLWVPALPLRFSLNCSYISVISCVCK